MVMPLAPLFWAKIAAVTGSGCDPPRAFRMVATWSILTPSRILFFSSYPKMLLSSELLEPLRELKECSIAGFDKVEEGISAL